jgi:hypothetical protein
MPTSQNDHSVNQYHYLYEDLSVKLIFDVLKIQTFQYALLVYFRKCF